MTNAEQDVKIAQTKQEVDDFKATIENFIQEMRDRDNRRDADIRELRQKQNADREKFEADMKAIAEQREKASAKHEADMKEMNQKIDNTIKHIQGITIASMVGIGAIAVSVIIFVANSIFNPPQPNYYPQPPAQTQTVQIPH